MSSFKQICIMGGGPVGLTLANCLARSPLIQSILLIDRHLPRVITQPPLIPNQRVYSINQSNLQLLKRINGNIRNSGKMENIHVVSKQSQESISWSNNTAQIIQNNQLTSSLMTQLQTHYSDKIQMIEGQINSTEIVGKKRKVTLTSGQTIETKLLVGSDGNKSKVKQLMGIGTYGWSYRQKAIVCTLEIQPTSNNKSAYQIYYQGNTLAVLPLWNNYVSIVWSLQLPQFQYLFHLPNHQFISTINHILKNANAYCNQATFPLVNNLLNQRLAFPLHTLQADKYIGDRVALIGDAAHSIHPMAGMGVNAGMSDAVFLANNIILNLKTGNDIGNEIALTGFQVNSKKLNYLNSITMEAIKKLFEFNCLGFSSIRKVGMKIMGKQNLKNQLKKMGEQHPLSQKEIFEWETI